MDDARLITSLLPQAKLRLLKMHYESGVGHIGGNLSSLDILMSLYHRVMTPADAFVLSKGHAAGALYVTLWSCGRLREEDLQTFHHDGTHLPGHPPARGIPDVLFATGSLGHGLSLACGLALHRKLTEKPGRVFCLLSDGEWNEGSNWESLVFAAHQDLQRLICIVDANGLQGFGSTREVARLEPLVEKFRAFGIEAREVDGHDPIALARALNDGRPGPRFIVARTVKGHGVSFMENRMEWHYLPMNGEQYRQAVEEIQRACETPSAAP